MAKRVLTDNLPNMREFDMVSPHSRGGGRLFRYRIVVNEDGSFGHLEKRETVGPCRTITWRYLGHCGLVYDTAVTHLRTMDRAARAARQ